MKIISHRGYKYKENTLEALNYAFNIPYVSGVEFDVRISKDKKFVLFHDYFLNRMTSAHGVLNNTSYRKLKKYDLGGGRIPLLKNVLKLETNKIFMLEIKFSYKEYLKNKRKFLRLLNKFKNKNIYICSFNKKIINDLKNKTNFKLGIISTKQIKDKEVNFYSINYLTFTNDYLKNLKNKEVFLWTINNKNDINKIKGKNIGIITDYVERFKCAR